MPNKRVKPDHDSSLESESGDIYKKSKLIAETSTKIVEEKQERDMEVVKKMLKEIQGELKAVQEELKAVRTEVQQNNAEIKNMREQWQKEKGELIGRIGNMEIKIERLERERIRNNIVVTGISIEGNKGENIETEMQSKLEEKVKTQVLIKKVYRINPMKYIVEMQTWEGKMEMLRRKNMLKGTKVYIDSDMTEGERKIQKSIREMAKEEREKGARVRVRYQRIEVDGREYKWNHREGGLSRDFQTKESIPKN